MSIRNKRPETKFYAKAQLNLAEEKIDGIMSDLDWLLGLMENLGIADDKPADSQSFREKVEAVKTAINPSTSRDLHKSVYIDILHLEDDFEHLNFGEGLYTNILPRSEWRK